MRLRTVSFHLKNVLGKRTNRDIYNKNKVLLVPINTIVTSELIVFLRERNVHLRQEDVQEIEDMGASFDDDSKMMDETVDVVKAVFGDIRQTKKIPIINLREQVIPMIHEASDGKHLLHLFAALQVKDDYTFRHNIAVGVISNLIGKWMKLDHQELLQLTTAALLHDVGKTQIPKNILNKSGTLTSEEFQVMKKHTIYGYEILRETVGITHRQALVALQHHERMDGSGYPMGVKRNDIDLFSRIVSVADVFHAMSSNRVYQNQFPFYKVIAEMERDMFGILDPEITLLFIKKTMSSLVGNIVLLTDGRKGTILTVSRNNPTRPLIKIEDEFIDLSQDLSLQIEQVIT